MKPLLAALSLLFMASPLVAQNTCAGSRNLAFGPVVRGVQSTVAPSDPIRSGRFYIRYRLNRNVRVAFALPNRLTRVGGGNLPITFTTTSAIAQGTGPSSVPVPFNPNTAITFTLVSSADFYVNLGARVSPAANQTTGAYSGTITLTCTFL
jgi:hypothetical protein